MAGRGVPLARFYLTFSQLSSLGLCDLEGEPSLHVPDYRDCLAPCMSMCHRFKGKAVTFTHHGQCKPCAASVHQ